jgi:hypothetical protein
MTIPYHTEEAAFHVGIELTRPQSRIIVVKVQASDGAAARDVALVKVGQACRDGEFDFSMSNWETQYDAVEVVGSAEGDYNNEEPDYDYTEDVIPDDPRQMVLPFLAAQHTR